MPYAYLKVEGYSYTNSIFSIAKRCHTFFGQEAASLGFNLSGAGLRVNRKKGAVIR